MTQQQFFGPIFRNLMGDDFGSKQLELFTQLSPQPRGQIVHRLEIVDPFAEQPAANLIGTIRRFPLIGAPLRKLLPG